MYTKLTQILSASLLTWIVPIATAASSHGPLLNRHSELAKRAEGDIQLFRRVSSARWTYYNVETGNAFDRPLSCSTLFLADASHAGDLAGKNI